MLVDEGDDRLGQDRQAGRRRQGQEPGQAQGIAGGGPEALMSPRAKARVTAGRVAVARETPNTPMGNCISRKAQASQDWPPLICEAKKPLTRTFT